MKKIIKKIIEKLGYKISAIRFDPYPTNPLKKISEILKNKKPIVFDIGANAGSSIDQIISIYPHSIIHAFEPSPKSFFCLKQKYTKMNKISVYQMGVGRREYSSFLNENEFSDMNSFLNLGEQGWGKINKKTKVPICSLDAFTKNKKIKKIHFLKIDTQGFEMEVFKGAERLFKSNSIGLILFEATFSNIYIKAPRIDELLKFLLDRDFKVVNFYDVTHISKNIGWCDILMINQKFFK